MKKKYLILVIVLVLIAVLIWFLFFRAQEAGVDEPVIDEPVSEELTSEQVQEEILKCEKEKAYFQASCFKDLAIRAKDPDLCARVSDIKDVGYESSQYIIHEGVCLALVAKELDYDVSLCERVEAEADQHELCVGYVAQLHSKEDRDSSYCEGLSKDNIWYANCLAASVTDVSQIGICDQAKGFYKEVCRDQAHIELMLYHNELSYCDSVDEPSNRAVCVASYAEHNDDLSLCHTLGSDKHVCICYNMYFDELNQEACDGLTDPAQIDKCQLCLNMDLFK